MREINQAEILAVSGAGMTDYISQINNALVQVNDLYDTAVASIQESTSLQESVDRSFKAIGLGFAKEFLSVFSNFLTKFAS